jgi:hypothetical protein
MFGFSPGKLEFTSDKLVTKVSLRQKLRYVTDIIVGLFCSWNADVLSIAKRQREDIKD